MTVPLVLSFDLDDTLWPVSPVIAGAEQAMFAWLRERHQDTLGSHDLDSLRLMRAQVADRFPGHAHDLTFLRQRALIELFAGAGQPEALADEALEVFLAARNRVAFYDDVLPSLVRLRSRYRLFAISNGNADLARCGLGGLFAGHVTARGAGAAKPDPRIYAQLLELCGVEAGQVLHIGDDPLADVAGATRAGMQAAWLNRDAREWPASLSAPPRTISTLAEIV